MDFSEFKDWVYRQIKEYPNSSTYYIVPFYLEELIPHLKQYVLDNKATLKNLSMSKIYLKVVAESYRYTLKLPQYVLTRKKNKLLNKSWFSILKESNYGY